MSSGHAGLVFVSMKWFHEVVAIDCRCWATENLSVVLSTPGSQALLPEFQDISFAKLPQLFQLF